MVAVAAAVIWNLVHLRGQLLQVAYFNDSAMHEQMVRFAASQLRSGSFPLTGWYPYLGLGSPHFLHYQSLPAFLTGALGLAVGPNVAFGWTTYLLLSLWPISVYVSARLFGISRWAAACSAAMSPFLMSATHVGYGPLAYLWIGFGIWTQLWASMTLPLAWGSSWRAVRDGRHYFAAVLCVSLTIALHFETGYLALLALPLWAMVAHGRLALRVRRAAIVTLGSLVAAAWVIVPLIENRAWAATNEILRGTPLENGYGARRVLGWLASGQLLDAGRVPVITAFFGIGLAICVWRCRRDSTARAILAILVGCLVLSFGRTTLGPLTSLVPGSSDLFFRRFMMGVQLAALLAGGVGMAWTGQMLWRVLSPRRSLLKNAMGALFARIARVRIALPVAALALVLLPAWKQVGAVERENRAAIHAQRSAESVEGAEMNRLIDAVRRAGGGRVYAGTPSNWGKTFRVGAVPVYLYLASRDVDEVGLTLRTASLMTDPAYFLDERNPGDYSLFAIRYVILPAGRRPPIPLHRLLTAGPYSLWTTGARGYMSVGSLVGQFVADRTNVGLRSIPLLRSRLPGRAEYLSVAWTDHGQPTSLPARPAPAATGDVLREADDLRAGQVTATVRATRPGVAVLSSSFDPGWRATVNGRVEKPVMVAPALVGVKIPSGVSKVTFQYRGPADYGALLAISATALCALLLGESVRRRRWVQPRAHCAE